MASRKEGLTMSGLWSAVEKEPTSQLPPHFKCDGKKGDVLLRIIVQDEIAFLLLPDTCNSVSHLVAEVHDVHHINQSEPHDRE